MRQFFICAAFVACAITCGSAVSQESSPSAEEDTRVSPDKKWEYRPDESGPKIVNVGTNEMALDLSDQPAGNGFSSAAVIWAPDSKRFAFNYGQGREHATSLYQLRNDKGVTLKSPGDVDEILKLTDNAIKAQAKKAGVPKKTRLHELEWTLKVHQWVDSNTAILYASLVKEAGGKDEGFAANFLFTLEFDDAGNWKIVKRHQISNKEAEQFED